MKLFARNAHQDSNVENSIDVEIPPKSRPSIRTQKLELNFVKLKNRKEIKT